MNRRLTYILLIAALLGFAMSGYTDGPLAPATDKLFGAVLPEGAAGAALVQAYEKSNTTATFVRAHWAWIQRPPAAHLGLDGPYDFSGFDSQPLMNSKKTRICIVDFAGGPRGRYPAADFLKALSKHAYSKGIRYFWLSADDYAKPDYPSTWYVSDLKLLSTAAKEAGKDALVIAGPDKSSDEAIQQFYEAGARGSFDVLAANICSEDPKFGIDIMRLLKVREVMARNGDSAKKMLVVGTLGDQAETCVQNSYRSILTKRDICDPNWIIGAAVMGKVDAALLKAFPPDVPAHTLECSIEADGPVLNYVEGKPYKLSLKFTGLVNKPIKLNKFAVDFPDAKGLAIDLKPGEAPKTAEPRVTTSADYTITFPKEAAGRPVLVRGTLEYSIDGKDYFTDCYFPAMVTSELELTLLPQKLILGPDTEPQPVGMSVINHAGTPYSGDIILKPYKGIKTSVTQHKVVIDPFGLDAFMFKVEKEAGVGPGHYAILVDVGGKLTDWIAVDVALPIKKAPGKIDIDGNLGEWKDVEPVKIVTHPQSGSAVDVGKGWFAYDDSNLYAAFEIDDAKHIQSGDASKITQEDSIQIAFDPLMNGSGGSDGGYRDDDYEYALAGADSGPVVMRLKAPPGKPEGAVKTIPFMFKNEGGKSYYEAAFPWGEVAPLDAKSKSYFGLSVLVNMSDGASREHAEWGGGLEPKVDPRAFMPALLVH